MDVVSARADSRVAAERHLILDWSETRTREDA